MAKLRNTLIGLMMAGLFGWLAFFLGNDIAQHWRDSERMGDWVLTKATVQVPAIADEPPTYRYILDGKSYLGKTLGVGREGAADFGYWREDISAFLEENRKNSKMVSIYVNPDNPAQSVVDREVQTDFLVWMGFFVSAALLLAVGGLAIVVYTWLIRDRSPRAKDWRGAGALWLMGLGWGLPTFAIALVAVPQALADGEWGVLLVLLFPLIGVILLLCAVAATIRLFTDGEPRSRGRPAVGRGGASLSLDSQAPRMGETLEGTMTFPASIGVGENMRIRLVCNEKSGGKVSAAWFRESIVQTVKGPNGPLSRFAFDVPVEVPLTPGASMLASRSWRVEGMQVVGTLRFGFPVKFYPYVKRTERTERDAAMDRIFGAKP